MIVDAPRRVVQFSCGAASAVAAKITLAKYPAAVVVNAFVAEEDADNRRFLADVERWLGVQIVVLSDTKYGASAYEAIRRARYTKGAFGAPCARAVKRDVLNAWSLPSDIPVIGYTAEEEDRADGWIRRVGKAEFPLIEAGLTKANCLAMVERAGIVLPRMYRMGYNNANCIGCVKGGEGYWNKIRTDFPERFEEMARIEESIGPSAYLFRDRATGKRISLRQLDPAKGRHSAISPECGFACSHIEDEIDSTKGGAG